MTKRTFVLAQGSDLVLPQKGKHPKRREARDYSLNFAALASQPAVCRAAWRHSYCMGAMVFVT